MAAAERAPELKVLTRAIATALHFSPRALTTAPATSQLAAACKPIDLDLAPRSPGPSQGAPHDEVFVASNGVQLIRGGYRHAESRLANDHDWLEAIAQARAEGRFDLSYEAQRQNAFRAQERKPEGEVGMFDRWWTMSDHEDVADWLVHGFIEAGSLVQVFGPPGCGKTFLTLDWACSIATGRAWLGNEVKRGPVLYVAAEGRRGLNRRLKAWCIANGVDRREVQVAIARRGLRLTAEASVVEFCHEVAEFARDVAPPQLVVIDTLARNFGPGDENSTADMNRVVAACDEIRGRTGAAVLLVHHTGHNIKSRARGSIVMYAAVDHEYGMDSDTPDPQLVILRNTKQKDDEQLPDICLHLTTVELGYCDQAGRVVTSCVLLRADADHARPGPRPGRGTRQIAAVSIYLQLLRDHEARLERGGFDPRTARVTVDDFADALAAADVPRQRISELRRDGVPGRLAIRNGFVTEMGGR